MTAYGKSSRGDGAGWPHHSFNHMVTLSLPSKEGVNAEAQISILYHIEPKQAPKIIETIGDGLNSALIQGKAIEAFRSLANSPSTKIIITDGRSPLLVSLEPKQ